MEEVWVNCQTCDPDYYKREGAVLSVAPHREATDG
jgi:hypothetical protein